MTPSAVIACGKREAFAQGSTCDDLSAVAQRAKAEAIHNCRDKEAVVARLDRAIQYTAAYQFNHRRLWNTGSSAFADDDSGNCSRGIICPKFYIPFALRK
ncbi:MULTISPECIES: hypothetical protein [Bradyrhizobium]|jgi:hypothetical protein|uniref:hypothetical protein n=1 Tax=Bradyrhizobium TaxID=374 RepID=UPI00115FF623|nr:MULTISPECIES: hypothetical protein [Bradyrhizobium]